MTFFRPRTKEKTQRPLRRRMMAMAVAGMALTTGVSAVKGDPLAAEATLPFPQRDGRVVLYVMDQPNLGLTDDMAPHVDQINYAFALLEGGEASGDHWQGIRQLEGYLARHGHIDGVLSVGGWGAEGFSDACATAEGRERLAESILRLMDRYGFTGVDFDWEYPGSSAAGIRSREEDVDNWYALLALLREGLDQRQTERGRDYLLSVALGAGEAQLVRVDGERLGSLVDQAVVMAYDLQGFDRITGHHAGLYPAGDTPASGAYAVNALTDSGLFAGKILLGVPAYGRVWRQVSGEGPGQRAATAGNRTLRFDELQQLEAQGYVRRYDEEAQAAWWQGEGNFVSGEDAESLAAKARWLKENGLLGAAVWAGHQDPQGALLSALSGALTRAERD
ncbi:MAG: glycoside hydrolase family 18 protein [Aristaeellaceae bacterium]